MESAVRAELAAEYPVSAEQKDRFEADGFIHLPGVLSHEVLAYFTPLINAVVEEYGRSQPDLAERNTYGQAFLQIGQLWRRDECIAPLCLAPRLGRIAADLMGVEGTRMYHDQALFKEPGGGFTPWHADQHYWPLGNDNTITAWIPLQDTPVEMGPLSFCRGSHRIHTHRDLSISDESEQRIGRTLKDYPVVETAFELGDVSFHRGWVFHRAGPNNTDRMRGVMTIIMMEDGIRKRSVRPSHANEAANFLPGIGEGEVVATHLNPVIFSHRG